MSTSYTNRPAAWWQLDSYLWAVLGSALFCRIGIFLWLQPFYDDAFITFRFAANFAAGHGLVFNEGERVLGTSTPLFAVLLGTLHRLSSLELPALSIGIGILSFPLSFLLLNSLLEKEGFDTSQIRATLTFFSFIPTLVLSSIAGMESSFVALLMILALNLSLRSSSWAGLALGALVLTRIDAIAFVGAVALCCVIFRRRIRAESVLTFIVIVGFWIVFTIRYYGSPIPNTAVAKMIAQPDAEPLVTRLWLGFSYYLKITSLAKSVLFVPFFIAGSWWVIRKRNLLGIALLIYFVGYVLSFAIPGAPVFPWYLVPGNVALVVLLGAGFGLLVSTISVARQTVSSAGLAALACILLAWLFIDASRTWVLMKVTPTREVANWIAKNGNHGLAFAEPAGIIGFYCDCRLWDNIGLVSPKVVEYYRRPGGRPRWFSTALKEISPDIVIFRQIEMDENKLFPEMTPLFNDEDKRWFAEKYERRLTANPPAYDTTLHRFYVYMRKDR